MLAIINRMHTARVFIFYMANRIRIFFAVGVQNTRSKNYIVVQCDESLPLVVMFTTTFIHYMVVIYIHMTLQFNTVGEVH